MLGLVEYGHRRNITTSGVDRYYLIYVIFSWFTYSYVIVRIVVLLSKSGYFQYVRSFSRCMYLVASYNIISHLVRCAR